LEPSQATTHSAWELFRPNKAASPLHSISKTKAPCGAYEILHDVLGDKVEQMHTGMEIAI